MNPIEVFVEGEPRGQPRVRPFLRGGAPRVYLPQTAAPWQDCIALAVKPFLPPEPVEGAVDVRATFFFQRPQSHYGTGKNAKKLKESAPKHCTRKPDVDNLEKALTDCLTHCGVWKDDAQVVDIRIRKRWAPDGAPAGAVLTVKDATED